MIEYNLACLLNSESAAAVTVCPLQEPQTGFYSIHDPLGPSCRQNAVNVYRPPRTGVLHVCVLCFLAGAYFAGSILAHILRYGVQVPFWDEWHYVDDFCRFRHGELSLSSLLLSQAGEHRIGLQVAFSILLWHFTGFNFRLIMVFTWSMSLAVTVLAALITRKGLQSRGVLPWAVWATTSLFIFNPAAYQLWIWDILPVYVVVPLLFLAGVHIAQYRIPAGARIGAAAVAALVASFAFGAGLVLWVLFPVALIPILGRREIARARLAVGFYAVLWLLTVGVYCQGFFTYRSPAPAAKVSLGVLSSFFLAYTGNLVLGFTGVGIVTWAHVAGLLVVLVFLIAVVGALKTCYGTDAWAVAVVWICVGVYATVAGVLVSLARYGFGVSYAVEASRYVLSSAILPAAGVALACICIVQYRAQLPRATASYSVVLGGLTVLITASLIIRGVQTSTILGSFRLSHVNELKGKVALSAANFVMLPEYRNIFPNDDWNQFRILANFITTEAGLRPSMWDNRFVQGLAALAPESGRYGFVDHIAADRDTVVVQGWAYLDDRGEAADAVIITGASTGEQPRLVAVAFPSQARPDVVAATKSDLALETGWAATIPQTAIPGGPTAVRCYAYDAESGRVHPLKGPPMPTR
jgi:hypothetical protein